MRNKNYRSKRTLKNSNKRMVVLAVLLLGLLGLVTFLELSHTTHFFRPAKTTQIIPVTKTQTTSTAVTNTPVVGKIADTPSTTTAAAGSQSQTDGSIVLLKPYGSFVSTHTLSANLNSQVLSSCTTSPATSCVIEFIKGSETKKLPAQITGGDGATSWLWKVKDAGLSVGSWQIKVTATLNGQTLSTIDPTTLEVQP